MWDLLGSGIEPVSPALAGRFFTTEPPGKPQFFFVYTQKWHFRITWLLYLKIFENVPDCFPGWLHHFTFPRAVHRIPHQHLLFSFQSFSLRWWKCSKDNGVLQPVQQVGIGSGRRIVWEKETRDRIQVWMMGPGDSRTLGSRACSLELHDFYLVSWQAESICWATMKSASDVPGHVSHFIDYTIFVIFLYKGYRLAGVIDSYMPWENISVCAQTVFWTCADPAQGSKVHTTFFLSLAGYDDPKSQPSLLLFGLCYIAIFCF